MRTNMPHSAKMGQQVGQQPLLALETFTPIKSLVSRRTRLGKPLTERDRTNRFLTQTVPLELRPNRSARAVARPFPCFAAVIRVPHPFEGVQARADLQRVPDLAAVTSGPDGTLTCEDLDIFVEHGSQIVDVNSIRIGLSQPGTSTISSDYFTSLKF